MAMADGNAVAERARDRTEAKREERGAELGRKALDDLVERVMAGEEYPRRATRRQINLLDILNDQMAVDGSDICSAVTAAVLDPLCWPDLQSRIEKIVRAYFADSKAGEAWIAQRAAEIEQEEREEAEETARDNAQFGMGA